MFINACESRLLLGLKALYSIRFVLDSFLGKIFFQRSPKKWVVTRANWLPNGNEHFRRKISVYECNTDTHTRGDIKKFLVFIYCSAKSSPGDESHYKR